MLKKRSIVLETPQLREILGENFVVSQSNEDQILLQSDRYCQIGCDLREISRLRDSLETLSSLADCPVLFVAEVSITYMDTKFADALIQWSSSVGKGELNTVDDTMKLDKWQSNQPISDWKRNAHREEYWNYLLT
ncbi:tRNA methyltransferase ppm2 [Metarhizium acridum]|uniref:tRNA methyltransferase ppm2 n=1 Tax=Metarhizium acridum TaxID=92637 RepID=UPI001C6CAFFD|nr:tRNA methyltransferase ppm2 [Metarhizium acridum]